MGQATRTTKLLLAHTHKLAERISYYSSKHLEMRERAISANELLTWAEACTIETPDHPQPWEGWNFSERFPGMPFIYRRSVIKDAIGKVRSYLSNHANWCKSGRKKGQPGLPGASNHPTLYEGAFYLELDVLDQRESFVRLKLYSGQAWIWVHYLVKYSRYFEQRRVEPGWEQQSPKLVLHKSTAELHYSQWQSGKPVKGEHSNQLLWQHVRKMNTDAAHQVARRIANVCARESLGFRDLYG